MDKTVFIFGGTGFVGRSITEIYLRNNWRVIIPTRSKNISEAKNKMNLHGFKKDNLDFFLDRGFLIFILNTNLADSKWTRVGAWLDLFQEINISRLSISRVMNLIGETSGHSQQIFLSNIKTVQGILVLVKLIKLLNNEIIFCNMGSVSENKKGENLPPYESSKKINKKIIKESGLCNYHFLAHYIKGRGEQKMKKASPFLFKRMKVSKKWFLNFYVSILDVDDMANMIYYIVELLSINFHKRYNVEVFMTNGEIIFGEIIRNLLPGNINFEFKPILSGELEKLFLKIYSILVPVIRPRNQLSRRLANFATRSLMSKEEAEESRNFKTSREIEKMSLSSDPRFKTLERFPYIVVFNKGDSSMYVLHKKNDYELKKIIQKALS